MIKQTHSLNISFLAGLATEWTEIQVTLEGQTMPHSNLNHGFHCLQTSVPGTCYHLPTEWPSHECSYQMSLKSILDSYTFLYFVCSWLYYTGTFVVMCLNTCDRKHLQTWNNFTFVGNNQSVSFILIVETKVSENFSLPTLLKRGIYIFIV